MNQRILPSKNPPTQITSSQLASRPSTVQARENSSKDLSQSEKERQAFSEDRHEASILQLKAESGTLTSGEEERLEVLQAKMNNFWVQRREKAAQFGHNLANIPISSPQQQNPTIQAKLTTSEPNKHNNLNNQKIQRAQDGYVQLKKTDDPEVEWHKNIGKQIVATYRIMDLVTEQIARGKNREALKLAAIGLGKAGLTIGSMFTGIPGLIGGLPGSDIALNTGIDTMAQTGIKTVGNQALSQVESKKANKLEREVQNTTTGGNVKGKVYDKVGTFNNACKTLIRLVPGIEAAEFIGKGVKTGLTSRDDWNHQKEVLMRQIREITIHMNYVFEAALIDLEKFGDLEIVTANKKNFFKHSRRTLAQVVEKFYQKTDALEDAICRWEIKHKVTPEEDASDSFEQAPVQWNKAKDKFGNS